MHLQTMGRRRLKRKRAGIRKRRKQKGGFGIYPQYNPKPGKCSIM